MMSKYKKLMVAVIGVVLLAIDQLFGFSVSFNADAVMGILIPVMSALGVWAVANE